MPHRLRFCPPGPRGRSLLEITVRCIQGRYLLRPSRRLNRLVVGVLAVAQRRYRVEVHACAFMSNHAHLLVSVSSQKQLSSFMNFLNSNVAREANRLHDWTEKFWSRRYASTPVVGGETVQVARLKYLLSQGTKEGLVDSPLRWPGVNCARALSSGRDLEGTWVNRTGLHKARKKLPAGKARAVDFEEKVILELSPLPCWVHFSKVRYRQQILALIHDIEAAASSVRKGGKVAGRRSVLNTHPHHRPKEVKTSPAPLVHAPSKEIRMAFLESYRLFTKAFRAAADLLRNGDLTAVFPVGSFPPGRPFVEELEGARPG